MSASLREQLLPIVHGMRRACGKKASYQTERHAEAVRRKRLNGSDAPADLFTYRCPICRQWHLTKLRQP